MLVRRPKPKKSRNAAINLPSFVTGAKFPLPDVVSAVTDHHRASDGDVIVACRAKRSALSTAAPAMIISKIVIDARIAGSDLTSVFFFTLA